MPPPARSLLCVLLPFLLCAGACGPQLAPIPRATAALGTVLPASDNVESETLASGHVEISARATKIAQLTGDYDAERQMPVANQTASRYGLTGTDLGVPFRHKGLLYLLFGDSHGALEGDAVAISRATNLEQGLDLEFLRTPSGSFKHLDVPGITQNYFEVPVEGISLDNLMYVYHTTDATHVNGADGMGRSVLAASDDDGQTFSLLYTLSQRFFINVSVVPVDPDAWHGLPSVRQTGPDAGLLVFGSGTYRRSNVYLAFQPSARISDPSSLTYFSGLDRTGAPVWSKQEQVAFPLFNQPCVGEFSVSYNAYIRKWIMLYNCVFPDARGINLRTADQPWGPWSAPQVIFDPWKDNGYCHFIHTSWLFQKCDNVHEPGRENEWGGEYGPYRFKDMARGGGGWTTIYFTMSTWNPYAVVLMKASLREEQGKN